jgi:WD40-like Beta Propeller Repeat
VTILNIVATPRNGSAIYTLNPDGSDLRRITPFRLNAGNPDWSPDGKLIVFNSSFAGEGRLDIYTVRPDGSGLRRVRREPRNELLVRSGLVARRAADRLRPRSRSAIPARLDDEAGRDRATQIDPRPPSRLPAGLGIAAGLIRRPCSLCAR